MDPEVSLPKYVLEQSEWYAGKARSNRRKFFWIRGYQIVVASVIPLVSLFGAWSAQRYVSAALGASIAIAEGLQQLGQFQQCLNQPPNQAMSVSSSCFTERLPSSLSVELGNRREESVDRFYRYRGCGVLGENCRETQ